MSNLLSFRASRPRLLATSALALSATWLSAGLSAAQDGAPGDQPLRAPLAADASTEVAPEGDGIVGQGAGLPPAQLRFELYRGRRELARGLNESAASRFRRIIEGAPAHPAAWFLLSRALSEGGSQAEAESAAARSVEMLERLDGERRRGFDDAAFHENLGVLREAVGDLAGAEASFRAAVEAAPDRPVLAARLGSVLLRRGDDEAAVAELRRAVEGNSGLAGAWRRLGQALVRLERVDEARAALSRARELAPEDPDVAFQVVQLHRLTGDDDALEAASERFERLSAAREERRATRERVDQLLRGAVAALREDGCEAAVPMLESALADDEVASTGYQRGRVLIDLAHCRQQAGDLDGAESLLRRALEDDPDSFLAHRQLGTLLAQRGRVQAAVPHLMKATAANPFDAPTHVNLGLAWAGLGRFNEALGELRRAVVLQSDDDAIRQVLLDLEWAVGNAAQAIALVELGGVEPPPGMEAAGLAGSSPGRTQ